MSAAVVGVVVVVVVVVVSIGELSCEVRDSSEGGVSIERGASGRSGVGDEVDDGFRWRYSASETFLEEMTTGVLSGELLRRDDVSISDDSARIRGSGDAISVLLFVMGEFVWDGDDVV